MVSPHNKINLDMDEIKRMYLGGNTATQIARHFGVSDCPIYNRLKQMGITRTNSESHVGIQAKENNPNWKGGRHLCKNSGYVIVSKGKKTEREHRIIAEKMLGRKLLRGEVVHHKNGDRSDNRPENLEILPSHSMHMKLHMTTEEARKRGRMTKRSKAALLAALDNDPTE